MRICFILIGIFTSNEVIYDFASSYDVSIDNMAFENPHKVVNI